jgi:hypothetical protein
VALASLVSLVLSPAAVANGGGGASKGYAATITTVTPANGNLQLTVLDADDRLELSVEGPHTVVIHGYEGEPYLRFTPVGVYRNRNSPATYLNDDRYAKVRLPVNAEATAAPDWERVAERGEPYDWHDHRIHWMSPSYPPKVEAARDRPHHIFDWTVPGTIDGQPLAIGGSLDYTPVPGQRFPRILIVPIVLLVVLGAVLVVLRRRRERHSPGHV